MSVASCTSDNKPWLIHVLVCEVHVQGMVQDDFIYLPATMLQVH